jgi:hypothetical protein
MTHTGLKTKRFAAAYAAGLLLLANGPSQAQVFSEGFANVAGLSAQGWAFVNNSFVAPVPPTLWDQGNVLTTGIPSHMGGPDDYVAVDFDSVDPPSQSNPNSCISNYLMLPVRTYNNGDVINFWSRKAASSSFPDRMQVRFSPNGASTNVGGTVAGNGTGGIGDFTTLLLEINPMQVGIGNPGAYPEVWTNYNIVMSGLGGPTSGRLAFRYFVVDISVNADVIAVDTLTITPIPEPASLTLMGIAALGLTRWIRKRR